MLSEREGTSTLNMLRNEHLDVRTVTLGVSLFDCVSHDLDLFTANVRAKLRRYASQLVAACDEVGNQYGIPVINKRISVSPIAVVGAPFGPDGMVRTASPWTGRSRMPGWIFWAASRPWWKKVSPGATAPLSKPCPTRWPRPTVSAPPSTWLPRAAASIWTPWP